MQIALPVPDAACRVLESKLLRNQVMKLISQFELILSACLLNNQHEIYDTWLENFSYNLGCFRHAQSLKVYYKSCSISLISCLSEKVDIQKNDKGGIMIRTWLTISISRHFLDNSFGRLDIYMSNIILNIFNMILKESFQT